MQQQSSNQTVVVPEPVTPVALLTEELYGDPLVENEVEKGGLEELEDNTEPDMHTPGEEMASVRRSARGVKLRELFTYDRLGQPSYHPYQPGVNLMIACLPFPMMSYPATSDHCYPMPIWTC
ncbi:hypothetical protein GOODEAATRI_028060 [Goodea atripinnis]|uniref:Uncharacterized protein n=1 Tax=Goodea atripinnis TaxID=208336 RepID=A0ABV0P1W6_9TELE